MITIFCNPRPFKGFYKITQINTIKNWKKVIPGVQIILVEDEEGTTKKISQEFKTDYIGNIKLNKYGTPLLDDTFEKIKRKAKFEIIAQINIDILLFPDFIEAVFKLKNKLNNFYMVGQRWDLDIDSPINFNDKKWQKKLHNKIYKFGSYHPAAGSDYWVFSNGIDFKVPPFIVGRPSADNWLIYKNLKLDIPVVDSSELVTIVHQNHPRKDSDSNYIIEKKINEKIYKKSIGSNRKEIVYLDLTDSTHKLTKKGLEKKKNNIFISIKKMIVYARYYPIMVKDNKVFWKLIIKIINPIIDYYLKNR